MKMVGYTRVSTDSQADHGLGLQVQDEAIRHWCKANGHRLVETYCDAGISGSKGIEERLGLHTALQTIKDRQANGLVVYKLDRIARHLTIQEAVLSAVWQNSGHAFTVDLGEVVQDDAADPMRTAFRQILGVFAQLERGMITARMQAGRTAKAAAGGYAGGAAPYGRVARDRELVADDGELLAVRRILSLRSDGLSLRQIGAQLTMEGIQPRRSNTWHPETISNVIARELPNATQQPKEKSYQCQ